MRAMAEQKVDWHWDCDCVDVTVYYCYLCTYAWLAKQLKYVEILYQCNKVSFINIYIDNNSG